MGALDDGGPDAGVQMLREQGAGEEMEAVLALFASFVMSPEQVRQIVRVSSQ